MSKKLKTRLQLMGYTLLYWVIAYELYDIFRRVGLSEEIGVVIVENPLTLWENFKMTLLIGLLTGFLYGLIEMALDKQFLKRKSMGVRILLKFIAYFFLINVILFTAIGQLNELLDTPLEFTYMELVQNAAVWSLVTYFLVCSLLYSFFRVVNEKFGPGVLRDMLFGKYRNPRVEKKIFMFMDLRSSTALAEQMGYLKYSSLIQQCFYDLNEIVQDYEGEIYQYVGDEAVISWDYEKGVKENLCIDCYFAFRNKLFERKDYYKKEFGLLPEFKAGLHGGELVVTEVGVVKKEIAYHGDVINTTARIQEKCNAFGKELLVSGELLSDLMLSATYSPASMGEISLKGKEVPVHIHAVSD